jgi:hypothetical protein
MYAIFAQVIAFNGNTNDFWDVAPCSLVNTDLRFNGAYCLHRHPNGGGNKLF